MRQSIFKEGGDITIRNLIFDMVGVLFRFDTEAYLEECAFTGEDRRILTTEVFQSLEWARLDRGTMVEEDAIASICSRTPLHLHGAVRDFIMRENRAIVPTEGMEDLLRQLKEKGYRLFMLSNTSSRWHVFWKEVSAGKYFEDTLISADVGLVKPDPEIFRLAFRKFQVVPEETVFIDDRAINAEAAFYTGIQAFVFHDDLQELRRWLRGLGVL